MRKLSVKKKVVLWFAFVLLVVFALTAEVIFVVGDKLARDDARSSLITQTDRTLKDVRIIGGQLSIDEDVVYYSDEVYILIYKDDGTTISGLEMEGFPADVTFVPDRMREIEEGDTSFYVYDRLLENKKVGNIWIRGMTSADLSVISPAIQRMIYIFYIFLPLIFIFALLGGWYITRRAFAPLKELNETAMKINRDRDLSLRVGVAAEKSGDEIMETARVFDAMLDELEDSFESEKRFTDNASHELRTPTAVIMGKAEYGLEHLDDRREVKDSLATILEQSHKMSDLIDNMLMFARADRNSLVINRDLVDLGLSAEVAAAQLKGEAGDKNITIDVEAEDEVYIYGDVALIERVLGNLISNAVKYGRENGHILITVSKEDQALITVEDDGEGIPEEALPHIWDRFYMSSDNRDNVSLGLGLSLVKLIVELHGGRVDVTSVEGRGTKFKIYLPL